jgi:hypothetical protein
MLLSPKEAGNLRFYPRAKEMPHFPFYIGRQAFPQKV